jgi:sugar phosphate isomerase/epimerase
MMVVVEPLVFSRRFISSHFKTEKSMNISRRTFNKVTLMTASYAALSPLRSQSSRRIRLGGPVFGEFNDPNEWAKAHRDLGYGAAYCPVKNDDPAELKQAYVQAAAKAGLTIAEVGAWSNPISNDETERKQAVKKNIDALVLADEIGATCAVNIAGSLGKDWAGIDVKNTGSEFFDNVVESVRLIIDAVNPKRAFYTLEAMPYSLPDSPDSYLDFIKAIDRRQFACHLDPVNMINSPRRFNNNGEFLRECFKKLGPYIKSCHAKDVAMQNKAIVHLDEVRPGLGSLDYGVLLKELAKLPDSVALMIEHLETAEEYRLAADHIRSMGKGQELSFV